MKARRLAAFLPLFFLSCVDDGVSVPSGPKLLYCPNYLPRVGTLVADPLLGGTLTLSGTKVTIPAGAVSSVTTFLVTIPASQYMEVDVAAQGLTSFLFNTPVTISIDYSRCNSPKADNRVLEAWHINTVTNALLEDMNGTDDKVARKVTFTTGHLSGYALAY